MVSYLHGAVDPRDDRRGDLLPGLQGRGRRRSALGESYVEHDSVKVLIAEPAESSPEDEFYDAKMSVLSEEIKHHVKEDEKPGNGVFA
jgi:hypothetical protein